MGSFSGCAKQCHAGVASLHKSGRKQSHWMWFIFPQIDGPGFRPTAQCYAIKGMDEAAACLAHPVLGERMCEHPAADKGRSASDNFGYPDDVKLCSSMTLFESVPGVSPVFSQVIDKYYSGIRDDRTLDLINAL